MKGMLCVDAPCDNVNITSASSFLLNPLLLLPRSFGKMPASPDSAEQEGETTSLFFIQE